MYHVLVSDPISEEGLLPLINHDSVTCDQMPIEAAEQSLELYDALLIRSGTKVTDNLLKKMPNLKIIARAGVGVDNIDIEAATRRGVIVINAPDGNTISTAEHTIAMIASLVRNIPQATRSVKDGIWDRSRFTGMELNGKTLGIIGMGRIGTEISKRAKAFGIKVNVYDPYLTKERGEKLGVASVSFNDLLESSDIITVHTPLTKETKGLLGFDSIPRTKKGVWLINCARGGIIDEEALYHFIKTGHVAGAALDVFETEPPKKNKLLELDEVITTPHIGASTKEAQLNVAAQVADEVLDCLQGIPIKNSINLPTISAEIYDKVKPFFHLTKKMGTILSQMVRTPVKEIELTYSGEVISLETAVLTRNLMAGFLSARVDSPVNEVNAPSIASQRGIIHGEKTGLKADGYSNLIQATVHGEEETFYIRGTNIQEYGERIVNLNGFDIDFYPGGNLLYIQHTDRPGVIGNVGKILGEHHINIATMQVGRKEIGGDAIMILSFDEPLDEEVILALKEIQDLVSVKKLEL
ncbi:phosphoglycerate dehydrogenase [Pseudalkalibacillus caeni]|uniref:D-3-phosphoglycerate dehydrogenase n=1 Tax=Exobacillus caeni TaxID=2574798 RepID=A0A5R9F570_9BACL|nr:phosphoglycerate dehydrogenase [Pseudalkalibacillus caeni]TLS35624.1 phosphoglycerate dehydrogenase [Pseudalkalibacillus caeni]